MKFFKVSLLFALVLGFLTAPSCAFAYENSYSEVAVSSYSAHVDGTLNGLNPMVKGSSGGGKSSGSSSSSSSKKVKTDSDDDDDNSTDDGSGSNSWIWIIIILVIIAGIFGVWYFFLRK